MKYNIITGATPAVTCELDPGEAMITQSGAMAWMSPNMDMQTSGGGAGKMFGRMFSGENLFQNPLCLLISFCTDRSLISFLLILTKGTPGFYHCITDKSNYLFIGLRHRCSFHVQRQ